jgi:hypothetical protein
MRNQGLFPKPTPPIAHHTWCVEERHPDPGVTDHYSRTWHGTGTPVDRDAEWRIEVVQRTTCGVPERAVVDVVDVRGAFANVASLVGALRQAQELADRINVGVRARREVTR